MNRKKDSRQAGMTRYIAGVTKAIFGGMTGNAALLMIFLVLALLLSPVFLSAEETFRPDNLTHHDLKVVLSPKEHRLSVEDSITLREGHKADFRFLLHSGLNPTSPTPGVKIVRESAQDSMIESFEVKLPSGLKTFIVKYSGRIYHPLDSGQEQARGFSETPGIIYEEGVYLAGRSYWYPTLEEGLISFSLQVELPPGWEAVSQGERTLHEKKKDTILTHWHSPEPQEEMFIVAAKFTEYTKPSGRITAMVFLRTPDKELADKYLDATDRYITMYEKLIGPYPYKKFALVENFWETGFGMPSFTLLGPKIIRFPFIVTSSYPHEILHNWWGNSVIPDFRKGNWSEGLTAYLSDHLLKEQQGSGVEYRQDVLQKYADYVLAGRDFPLTEFRSRHSSSTEAVGYGKALMFFHMLRRELGDETFVAGLREFYRENKFKFVSFENIRKSFEKVSGKDLRSDFNEWVTLTGAPKIKLGNIVVKPEEKGYALSAVIEQVQAGDAYLLQIPVAVTMEGQGRAYQTFVKMDMKRLEFTLHVPSMPLRIDVDPESDLFRRLDREEIPPAISQALGAKKMLVILPSAAGQGLLKAYRKFGGYLGNSGPDEVEVKLDKDIAKIPSDRAVTILGWENLFLKKAVSALSGYGVSISEKSVTIGKVDIPRENHSLVLTASNPDNKEMALVFIAADLSGALPGLGRKLPHYHKYSYLGFEGDEPANIAKGRWPVLDSPMTAFLPGRDGKVTKVGMAALAQREPLAALPQVFSKDRMAETVRFLSSDELKGRGFGTEELDRAATYIAEKFREAGLKPAGDNGSFFQTWEESFTENPPPSPFSKGGPENIFPPLSKGGEGGFVMKNVIGVIPGKKPEFSGQSIVIGAHYDHLGLGWPDVREENKGKIHHGADDNASGVSVLIELARVLNKGLAPDRSIVFAAFTGEEAGKRGSKYYVTNQKRYPSGECVAMVNLDTVGRLGKKKLLVLGADSAREWIHVLRGAGYVTGVEIETVSENLDSSDQISFEEAGIPAVQLFSGPHLDYHRPADTFEKIDPEGLVRVASVAKEIIEYLSGRKEPLTVTVKKGETHPGAKEERKVSLGTIPDFAFRGKGYRVAGVAPGSPAEESGLKEGDIVIRINSLSVNSLKDLSDILKSLTPASRVSITFLRDGKEMTVEAEVRAK